MKVNGSARSADLIKEVISLVVNDDECREVLYFDLPHCFHAKFWLIQLFNLGDAILRQTGCWATNGTQVETTVRIACIGHLA